MSLTIKLSRITLPKLEFDLPEHIGKASVEHYRDMSERLERLAHTAGTGSDSFRRRKEHIHTSLHAAKRVQEVVRTPKDIRPLVVVASM